MDDEDMRCSLPREDCPCTVAGAGADLHPDFRSVESRAAPGTRLVVRSRVTDDSVTRGAQTPGTPRSRRQAQLSDEIAGSPRSTSRRGSTETQPRLDYAPYRSSVLRHPTKDLHHADPETIELFAPVFGHHDVGAPESDLTIQHAGEPVGERIVVTGRVLDGEGRPVRRQLVEIWQANAAGRYIHKRDQHPAPIDPNFTGVGRTLTDDDGSYTFTTIKPGPYPWKNHHNAWRPAHIHFSMFGTEFTQRMITQMYFPGRPAVRRSTRSTSRSSTRRPARGWSRPTTTT